MERLNKREALEMLLLRLADRHPQRDFLDTQLYRTAGGKRGEQRLKARFKEFWIEEEYTALWDLSLTLGDWPVQIDGLLLTERCAVIIESKNISGASICKAYQMPGRLLNIWQSYPQTLRAPNSRKSANCCSIIKPLLNGPLYANNIQSMRPS